MCNNPTELDQLTYLAIYVAGSEGVSVCMSCRQTLTEVLRGMIRTHYAGRKQGYLAAKQVAEAKSTQAALLVPSEMSREYWVWALSYAIEAAEAKGVSPEGLDVWRETLHRLTKQQ